MKILKILSMFVVIACMTAACSSDEKQTSTDAPAVPAIDKISTSAAAPEHTLVTFETETYGKFVVETYPEYAPETVTHFLELVDGGFYNGFTIDCITQSKTILTSATSSALSSDSAAAVNSTVSGEFTKNGRSNTLKLDKYTLALNHIPNEYNSGNAQFMIFLSSSHDMDGSYAGFAKVIQGKDVIDKISAAEVDRNGTPVSPIVMKKVYINE